MKEDNNVEVFYTVPVEKKVIIRESQIKDWENEDEIAEWISENVENADESDIRITSID